MNISTITGILLLTAIVLALAVFGPRPSEPRAGSLVEIILRGLYRWARFWWAFAAAVDYGCEYYRRKRDSVSIVRPEERIVPDNKVRPEIVRIRFAGEQTR